MKKINYGLIVSDFDGTLITSRQEILPEVREKINEYVSSGGIFAVCTGRMLCCILPQVREMGLKGLVVAYQGAVIAEIESGKVLRNEKMSYESMLEICRTVESLSQPVNAYCDDDLYTSIEPDNEYLKIYESIVKIKSKYVGGKVSDFIGKNKIGGQKISVLVKKEERDALYSELSRRLGKRYDVTCSAKTLVEISPLTANKGDGLKYLADHYNIPLSETVAIGDNLNDLSMILAAGVGVAVGNADELLKSAANDVTASNNDGGVAKIIDKYGFA